MLKRKSTRHGIKRQVAASLSQARAEGSITTESPVKVGCNAKREAKAVMRQLHSEAQKTPTLKTKKLRMDKPQVTTEWCISTGDVVRTVREVWCCPDISSDAVHCFPANSVGIILDCDKPHPGAKSRSVSKVNEYIATVMINGSIVTVRTSALRVVNE